MCSIGTRRCDLRSNHRLKSFVTSRRRRRIEGKYGNTDYLVLCGLTELVLREVGKVDTGGIAELSPWAAAVERADEVRTPSDERTQQLFRGSWIGGDYLFFSGK